MSGKQYWKNKIPYVTGNFLAMAVLAVFLLLGGNTRDSVLFIRGELLVILAVSMGAAYMCRRKQNGYIAGKRESAGRKISDCGSDGLAGTGR